MIPRVWTRSEKTKSHIIPQTNPAIQQAYRAFKKVPLNIPIDDSEPQSFSHAPCTFNPASTWIRIPVILLFLANMTKAATVSSRYVSCLSTAASLSALILSSLYLLP